MLELGVSRPRVDHGALGQLGPGRATAQLVEGDPVGDRQHPRAQVVGVLEARVGAESAQEGFLERVLGSLAADEPNEPAEHLVAVGSVEALERRDGHGLHHEGNARGVQNVRCMIRVAVVGHVEWVEFLRVERVPRPGEIVSASEVWSEPAGGGAVAAVQLARLAGHSTFFTALGDDEIGRRARDGLIELGVRVEAAIRDEPQRRAFVYVDGAGERTITLLSRKLVPHADDPLPWGDLAWTDAVYFTGGDQAAVHRARGARVLVATARELPTLAAAGVQLDALVRSGSDESEAYAPGDLDPVPRLAIATSGAAGGSYSVDGGPEQQFAGAPLPGLVVDAYGAGDSFAAGLTFALAERRSLAVAIAFAARCGAAVMTGRGPYGAQLPR